jgi:hypothetical protein
VQTRTAVEDIDDGEVVVAYNGIPVDWIEPTTKPGQDASMGQPPPSAPVAVVDPQPMVLDDTEVMQTKSTSIIVPQM